MDAGTAIDLSREALIITLIVAGPIMAIGLLVGLAVSIFQAVTQLQEQTLSFVPKIVGMGVAAAFFLPWFTARLVEYTHRLWSDGM